MSGYRPEVGDIVTAPLMGYNIRVTAVGEEYLLAKSCTPIEGDDDDESFWKIDDVGWEWIKVEPSRPLPERWWYIHCKDGRGSVSVASASPIRPQGPNVAVLHIWTDEHGVDHAEIERG